MTYEYTELDDSTDPEDVYVRLFHLLPKSSTGQIVGQLQQVLLSSAPSYEALSYCWGRHTDTSTIYIADPGDTGNGGAPIGKALAIPNSLHSFLDRYRLQNRTRTFWIDAVCINQKDDKEKTSQVPKMRDIYMRAKWTFSWLGPEADGSTAAFEYAESLNKLFRRKLAEANIDKLTDAEKKQGIDSFEFEVKVDDPRLAAMFKLLNRPYFERAWIVQECNVSSNVWVVAGNSTIHWHVLFGALFYILHFQPGLLEFYPSHRFMFIMALRWGEVDWQAGKDIEWWRVLLRQRSSLSKDPRDKIYAYYGLRCKGDFEKMDIKPDYESTSTNDLYIKLASRAFERLQQAEILSIPRLVIGQDQIDDKDWQELKLPSWVPDWRWTEGTPLSLLSAEMATEEGSRFKVDYNATQDTTFEVDFDKIKRDAGEENSSTSSQALPALPAVLRVHGYTVAKITQLSPRSWTLQKPTGRQTLLEQARVLQENQIQVAEWETVFQPSNAPLTYTPTNETFTAAAVETLTVARSTYTQEQRYAAWSSYETRQRFLRLLPQLGLHHFVVSYVLVILLERVLRYFGVANPEMGFRAMTSCLVNRKFARAMGSSEGDDLCEYLGLVPGLCRPGDCVVLVTGVRLPLVLRAKGEHVVRYQGKSRMVETWELIGDAYVHGLVKGEAWVQNQCEEILIA